MKDKGAAFIALFGFVLILSILHGTAVRTSKMYEPARRHTIIIDAGHGGEDGGAVGISGILEKEINLGISRKLENLLMFCGVNTKMTRNEDVSLNSDITSPIQKRKAADIKERVKAVAETPNAVLISVHQNSFPQNDCKGAQVFFSKNNVDSKLLAEKVQSCLKDGINDGNHRVEKQADDSIYILKNVNCPAVLVECGFVTNARESELLMTEKYRLKLALCIAGGYLKYICEA